MYRCKVTNAVGSIYSRTATLSVTLAQPEILAQENVISTAVGEKVCFEIVASGGDLSYQWYYQKPKGSTWILSTNATATTPTLEVTAKAVLDGYKYRCLVSNTIGSVYSDKITLKVASAAPSITTQPANVSVASGEAVTFEVTASGGGLSYQWYYQKPGSSAWILSTNATATTSTLKITSKPVLNGYKYRCEVINAEGAVYSSAAKLTIN